MDKGKGKMVDLKGLTEGLSKGTVRADFGHAENARGRPAMHGEMDKQHQRMRETGEARCEGMSQIQSKSSMLTLSVLIRTTGSSIEKEMPMHVRLNRRIGVPTLDDMTVLKGAEPESKGKGKEVTLEGPFHCSKRDWTFS
jgi:hypothetical protein